MEMRSIKGTNDIMEPEINKWRYIEKLARHLFESYGYQEIHTPIIEYTNLFKKSIGQTTDIVKKEMFTFKDRGSRSITLRPEETASVVRAYLEHKLYKKSKLVKLYYIGPMFRSEKPQAGRMRQFHQMGVEVIGSYDPYLDAEIIALMYNITTEIGLRNFNILLNSLGCLKDRERYRNILKQELKEELKNLCQNCKQRYNTNPLRILDCKNPHCKKIIKKLPSPIEYICDVCRQHFEKVKESLKAIGVPYTVNSRLVRGLDYYTRTIFELTHSKLGAKNAICAGGRYDNLVSSFGGPKVGACGFAFGIERLIMATEAEKIELKGKERNSIYVAVVNEEVKNEAYKIVNEIRNQRIKAYIDYQDRSLRAQMRQANKLQSKFVIVVGEDELKKGKVVLKDMEAHTQSEISKKDLVPILKEKLS